MSNEELVNEISKTYRAFRDRTLLNPTAASLYETVIKYEIVCWLEEVADIEDKYYDEIFAELKKMDDPLDFMFEAYRDGDEGTRDRICNTTFDAIQWRKDYGENQS